MATDKQLKAAQKNVMKLEHQLRIPPQARWKSDSDEYKRAMCELARVSIPRCAQGSTRVRPGSHARSALACSHARPHAQGMKAGSYPHIP